MARDPLLKDRQYPPVRVRSDVYALTERAADRKRVSLSVYIRDTVERRVRRELAGTVKRST